MRTIGEGSEFGQKTAVCMAKTVGKIILRAFLGNLILIGILLRERD